MLCTRIWAGCFSRASRMTELTHFFSVLPQCLSYRHLLLTFLLTRESVQASSFLPSALSPSHRHFLLGLQDDSQLPTLHLFTPRSSLFFTPETRYSSPPVVKIIMSSPGINPAELHFVLGVRTASRGVGEAFPGLAPATLLHQCTPPCFPEFTLFQHRNRLEASNLLCLLPAMGPLITLPSTPCLECS